jgi:hypothetical protein
MSEIEDLDTMIARHAANVVHGHSDGLCKSCFQPWPCDFTRLLLMVKGGAKC